MNDEIFKSIYEIKYPGTYMLKVYNEKTKKYNVIEKCNKILIEEEK